MSRATTASAWIAFGAVILALIATVGMQVWDRQQQREHEILAKREEALLQALHVIDNVYANSHFSGLPQLPRREWDIDEARDAMNKILIYCEDPNKTMGAFLRCVGRDPIARQPAPYNVGMIQGFREEVARELHLPKVTWHDPECTWFVVLPGTREELEMKKGSDSSDTE